MFGKPPLVSWFEGFGVFGGHFRVNVIGSIVGEPTEPDPLGRCNGIMYEFVQVLSIGIDHLGGATPQCPALEVYGMLLWLQWLNGRMLVNITILAEGFSQLVHFHIQLGYSVELVVVEVIMS